MYQVGDRWDTWDRWWELVCIFQVGALPADGFSIRGSTSPWTDAAFVTKYEECKSDMKKEGNDIEKVKCPKN